MDINPIVQAIMISNNGKCTRDIEVNMNAAIEIINELFSA